MEHKDYFKGKNVLITGASGYIGSALIHRLLDYDTQITAIDIKPSGSLQQKKQKAPNILVIETDVRQRKSWRGLMKSQDVIFHLAAQTNHYLANKNPERDWKINCVPVLLMLQACHEENQGVKIIYASTVTVYGLPTRLPVNEGDPTCPITVYDIHKLAAERYLTLWNLEHNLATVSLRLANVYGPSLSASGKDRGILNLMAAKALHGERLTVYGEGCWLRDYVHINDVVEAFLFAPQAIITKQGCGRAFNISTNKGTKFVDVVTMIAQKAGQFIGRDVLIQHIKTNKKSAIDERNFIGSYEAFFNIVGWKPTIDINLGITDLVASIHAKMQNSPR
jgi:UDP-glucose 4-epimerase